MGKYYKKEWLQKLDGAIPRDAGINGISMYAIALEGWRRGLRLKFHKLKEPGKKPRVVYSLRNKVRTHFFDDSSGDLNTAEGYRICDDKHLTNKFLSEAGLPIPKGRKFSQNTSLEEIIKYTRKLTYPLVVKPTDGLGGKGVIANIENEEKLRQAITYVRDTLNKKNILVQEFVKGREVRVYVINNKVIGAVNRIPANIVGDGISSIAKLIEQKNKLREQHPHIKYRPIRIDNEIMQNLKKNKFTLDSVLNNGEKFLLRQVSNVSRGGDPIDVTDQLTNKQIEIAIKATKAIPGLEQCGVDMIINDDNDSGVIIELNASPGIGSHLFPMKGEARDIPKAIIDYYFPETKNIDTSKSNYYFDFQSVFDAIEEDYVDEIEIQPCPSEKLFTRKYIICRDSIELLMIENYIRDKGINGSITKLDNNIVEIIIGTPLIEYLVEFRRFLKRTLDAKIVKEEKWDNPLKVGIQIQEDSTSFSLLELKNEYTHLKRKTSMLIKERDRLKHRINLQEKSRTWRMTSFLRIFKK